MQIVMLYYAQQREVPVLHVLIHESLGFPFFMPINYNKVAVNNTKS